MTPITARRRHPAAGYAVVLLGLLCVGLLYAFITGGSAPSASGPDVTLAAQSSQGRTIFLQECSSCHGLYAQGVAGLAPSLIGVGSYGSSGGQPPLVSSA